MKIYQIFHLNPAVGRSEELLSDTDSVFLRSDRSTSRLGFTLSEKERPWLREAIRDLLVQGWRHG